MKVVFKSVIFVYSGKRETLIKQTEYERDPATVGTATQIQSRG